MEVGQLVIREGVIFYYCTSYSLCVLNYEHVLFRGTPRARPGAARDRSGGTIMTGVKPL